MELFPQGRSENGMNEATIVIPNWNGMKYLQGCLDSLRAQTQQNFRILMIDNGSEDGSLDFVRSNYPEIRIRAFHRNTGFCRAVNEGIRLSTTPFVILLNNDTVCAPDFVKEMLAGIKRHEKAFSCSARMMQMHAADKIDDAGDLYCALGWAFADGKGLPAGDRMKEHPVFSSCGGAAIYRRDVFEKIGLFDERHFAYLEDVDIGFRAKRAGYENWYLPKAEVLHAGSAASGSRYNAFKTRLTSRNSIYLIRKNMPVWQILLNLPLLAAGFLIKTLFFTRLGLGGLYIRGLAEGLRPGMGQLPETTVKMRQYLGASLKIQLELWKNTVYRLLLRHR